MSITCKQAVDYISRKEEGKLSTAQRFALWQHLAICTFCRAFNRQNRLLRSVFKKYVHEQKPVGEAVNKKALIEALQQADE